MPGMSSRRSVPCFWWCSSESGGDRGRHRDQDVHVQAPAPGEVLGEDAAEQQADGGAGDGDAAVEAEGFAALVGVGEGGGQQRERRRGEDRAEGALQGAGADQDREAGGEAAERGGAGEPDQADDEDALAAEEVADPAAEQQQAAEGERVGGDDPLAGRVGEAERFLGGRQGDVDDRRVEDDHQLGEAEDREDQPAALVVGIVVGDSSIGPRGGFGADGGLGGNGGFGPDPRVASEDRYKRRSDLHFRVTVAEKRNPNLRFG